MPIYCSKAVCAMAGLDWAQHACLPARLPVSVATVLPSEAMASTGHWTAWRQWKTIARVTRRDFATRCGRHTEVPTRIEAVGLARMMTGDSLGGFPVIPGGRNSHPVPELPLKISMATVSRGRGEEGRKGRMVEWGLGG